MSTPRPRPYRPTRYNGPQATFTRADEDCFDRLMRITADDPLVSVQWGRAAEPVLEDTSGCTWKGVGL